MIIKKKLRDISLEELKIWSIKNCKKLSCEKCVFLNVYCDEFSSDCWVNNKDIYSDKFLNQEIEIETDILSEKEKEYLKSIIKPFKDRVEYIEKKISMNCTGSTFYYITIAIKSIVNDNVMEIIALPYFKLLSKMYEGMELNREYTLKELKLL